MAVTRRFNALILVSSIGLCLAAGALGSLFTSQSVAGWYQFLAKPAFNPPDWLFGPVWTTLFILMGIAFYIVLSKRHSSKKHERQNRYEKQNRQIRSAEIIFMIQLGLNVLWSGLFFGLRSPTLALVEIIILWLAILATVVRFARVSRPAAYLLLPYLIWVSFAVVLNAAIAVMN